MDINPQRLEMMGKLSNLLVKQSGARPEGGYHDQPVGSGHGTDFVITAISVGGL